MTDHESRQERVQRTFDQGRRLVERGVQDLGGVLSRGVRAVRAGSGVKASQRPEGDRVSSGHPDVEAVAGDPPPTSAKSASARPRSSVTPTSSSPAKPVLARAPSSTPFFAPSLPRRGLGGRSPSASNATTLRGSRSPSSTRPGLSLATPRTPSSPTSRPRSPGRARAPPRASSTSPGTASTPVSSGFRTMTST